MTSQENSMVDTRERAEVEEAGTAPDDRRFRPDVEGLRAVAVVLVVLYHGGLQVLSGGYVGVDVFFVISGFVITGLLLRERGSTGRTSIRSFYGRRSRRIIPAATLVIMATVGGTYLVLGSINGIPTAIDARWTAVFLANFHFASIGTNYLTAQQPPSPLLNFWTLAVEEQFYLVYPAFFMLIAALRVRLALRMRLLIGLSSVIAVSFLYSVIQTNSNPTVAYFSPLTRAWELALGALLAVGTVWLRRIPARVAAVMTWAGLSAIFLAALTFNAQTAYPGFLAALPVVGTALVVAGGVVVPRGGAEYLLGIRPLQWLGRRSYSLYLWHWPILIIAAEEAGRASLPFRQNLVWLALALVASILTYALVENPIRHAHFFANRRWVSIGVGVALVAATVGVATFALHVSTNNATASFGNGHRHRHPPPPVIPLSAAQVQVLVKAAPGIRSLPGNLTPSMAAVHFDWGGPPASCWPAVGQTSIPSCTFGDLRSSRTMVIYGDSHAGMWFHVLKHIATKAHWKLVYLGKGYCPANTLKYQNPDGWGKSGGEYAVCDAWHRFAIQRVQQVHPDLVIVTQEVRSALDGSEFTPSQWRHGLELTLQRLGVPPKKIVVLGNVPVLPNASPWCIARHASDIHPCFGPVRSDTTKYNIAEQMAATTSGSRYIDATPWFCSSVCTPVIGNYQVYWDNWHITASYSKALETVLTQGLSLSIGA